GHRLAGTEDYLAILDGGAAALDEEASHPAVRAAEVDVNRLLCGLGWHDHDGNGPRRHDRLSDDSGRGLGPGDRSAHAVVTAATTTGHYLGARQQQGRRGQCCLLQDGDASTGHTHGTSSDKTEWVATRSRRPAGFVAGPRVVSRRCVRNPTGGYRH